MFKDVVLNCDFSSLLNVVNQQSEIIRAKKQNRFITNNLYPLTKNFLQSYYLNSPFTSYKKTFKDVECAAQVYSYFLMTYGYSSEAAVAQNAGSAFSPNSSGLGLLGQFNLDLGFNLGELLKSYWWILALIGVIYISKD